MARAAGGCTRRGYARDMASRARRPLMRPSAFWDSSALVPLCARQPGTPQSKLWLRRYEIVVWWATPVEIASALARLLRVRQLDSQQWSLSVKFANKLVEAWSIINPSDRIRADAMELVKRYDLRAADSLQMAAALQWCEASPQGRTFLTADMRLRDAARLVGFDV
jgi:predicted nucleic acid-binding protein